MDATDRGILEALTQDSRISYTELGRRVGLSANAAADRVRRLRRAGVIRRFTVEVDPAARPGRAALEVFIDLRLAADARYQDFEARAAELPEIADAVHMTGPYDYLVHAYLPDAAGIDRLVRILKRDAGVAQTATRLALRSRDLGAR